MTMTARESATHTRSSGGWVARREAAVRVLTDLAGLSTVDLTGLTAADVTVLDGAATISTATRTVTVPPATGGMWGPAHARQMAAHPGPDRGAHRPVGGHRGDHPGCRPHPTPGRGLSCNRHHRPGYPATAAATPGGPGGDRYQFPANTRSVTGEYTRTPR